MMSKRPGSSHTGIVWVLLVLAAQVAPMTSVMVLCGATSLYAQQNPKEKLRMASAYEQGGDLRNAARIYQEVYDAAPDNTQAFQGTIRTLLALGQTQAAYDIATKKTDRKQDVESLLLSAQLAAKLNKLPEADAYWDKAARAGGEDEDLYLQIGQAQVQLFLHGRAIESYLKARQLSGDPGSYAYELASSYIAVGKAREATEELIAMYRSTGQSNVVRGLISAMMASPDQQSTVTSTINSLPDNPVSNLTLKQWVARENNDWPEALKLAEKVDVAKGTRGQEVLVLADAARIDGKMDVALEAYGLVMNNSQASSGMQTSAAYGYARTLELRLRSKRANIDQAEARNIIDRYGELVSKYPQNPMISDALLNIAKLEDEVFHNTDKAISTLERLNNTHRGTSAAASGTLLLADLYLSVGRNDLADELLGILANSVRNQFDEQRDLARLRRADLLFYRHSWDSAKSAYKTLSATTASVAANDAIEKMVLLAGIEDDSVAIKLLADAEWMEVQRKPVEAAQLYLSAAAATRDEELKDRCRVRAAHCFVQTGNDVQASEQLTQVINRAPDAINGDRALLMFAELREKNNDTKGAIDALTTLLVQYPRSILSPAARDRIRRLRGDT